MKREVGNIGDLITVGFCLLAMTVLMFFYLKCVKVFQQKEQVAQLSRKYILRMETMGLLTMEDEQELLAELTEIGVRELDLQGSTTWSVSYGEEIVLEIRGKLKEGYVFWEKRVSTAKY